MTRREAVQQPPGRLAVEMGATPEAVIEAQRLRYRVFAAEMGQ